MRSRRIVGPIVVALVVALAPAAQAAVAYPPGVEHLSFHAGPYEITPGANLILVDRNNLPKPNVDGYIVSMAPNLRYALASGACCGRVPRVDVIHLHHGVWLSDGVAGEGEGNSFGPLYPFMAAGEEKTSYTLPPGYGYPVGASDRWFLNYMIHNLTETPTKVYITYEIGFIPATSPLALGITPVHPIWMDVEAHHAYPVFDVHRYSGLSGRFTFPDMAKDPYGGGAPLNEFTVDHPGTLVTTAGHLHPGGLHDDLDLIRAGAQPSGPAIPGTVPNSVRLFRSNASYFDKRGPISWDMAMTATAPDWRPQVRAGDVLRISATYETRRASWYESMGIMVVFEAFSDQSGVDPFSHAVDQQGHVTHGHLPENNHHGGTGSVGGNPNSFPSCRRKQVDIGSFEYLPGDFRATGSERCAPTVKAGQSLTFVNDDASPLALQNLFSPNAAYLGSIFHTVTACQDPCGFDTGISYPLANGAGSFDSAQLGIGVPASGQLQWQSPASLKPGTYMFFCRIHPFMRGVFRVVG